MYSSIDTGGRYGYTNQPVAAEWNLARLVEALPPLFDADQDRALALAVDSLGAFHHLYSDACSTGMRAKLGLAADVQDGVAAPLVGELLGLLHRNRVDHTSFFRGLSRAARGDAAGVRGQFLDLAAFDAWILRWRTLGPDGDAMTG